MAARVEVPRRGVVVVVMVMMVAASLVMGPQRMGRRVKVVEQVDVNNNS